MHFYLLCSQELSQLLLKWSLVYEKYAVNAAAGRAETAESNAKQYAADAKKAKTEAVAAVEKAGTDGTTAVNNAATVAVSAVDSAKEARVSAVNAAVEKKQFNGVTWRSDGHL